MKSTFKIIAVCAFAAGSVAYAQPANPDQYVSKEEYQKLAAKVEQLEQSQRLQQTNTDESLDQLDKDLKDVSKKTKAAIPGTSKTLVTGYGSVSFQAASAGYGPSQPPEETAANGSRPSTKNFFASLNLIFLYEMDPKILFEGELELETDTGTRTIEPNLEQAQIHYLMTDNLTFAAGAFLDPMDYFIERQHMAWVNKLPDKPLAVYDGLLPETEVGAQLRGTVPVGPVRTEFSLFTAMAPQLVLSSDPTAVASIGSLDFDNYDVHSHLAVGGHVGIRPAAPVEVGYGFQFFQSSPVDDLGNALGKNVTVFLQSADVSYVQELDPIKGTVNFHAQWVFSHFTGFPSAVNALNAVDGLTYVPFANSRNGGYVQLAYRPSQVDNGIVKNFEGVVRYDRINELNSPVQLIDQRYTVGLDYWFTPSVVAKAAYEVDRQHGLVGNPFGNFAQNGHAFWLQFAVGF